ncbi:uncharacterized protein LOC111029331 [Myzus persicae]|uniref:uncharacterized protein LOC111029331 n=1 Tax=Myzus persicae TaxID=13164 RepID=UPI000B93245B|nr:uncharacterized protein LOC111029331 [Myzus persicae]
MVLIYSFFFIYFKMSNFRYITMVKLCVICGNVDGVDGVSVHRFPTNDQQRRQWVLFVESCGVNVQPILVTTKLCSRHFVVGHDYRAETNRRRLFSRAVPSLS